MKPKVSYYGRCVDCGYEGPLSGEEMGKQTITPHSWNPSEWVMLCPKCEGTNLEDVIEEG